MARKNLDEMDFTNKILQRTVQNKVPELKRTSSAPNRGYSDDAMKLLASGRYGQQHMAERKMHEYQNRVAEEQRKYQYDYDAYDKNTLDRGKTTFQWTPSDQAYLQRIYDRYGDSELTKRTLRESNRTKDWEKKYGKSYDEIYRDFLADQGNVKMEMGEEHPFLTEIGTVLNSVPTALSALPSLAANLIDPNSKLGKNFEEIRQKKAEENKYWRAGVKEHTGEKGDRVIDTANSIADRMANTIAGKTVGTALGGAGLGNVLGGTMAGLSDANMQLDDLALRGVDGRQKYASALAHGAVEGIGTGITGGILDKLPALSGVKGSLMNIGKGAGNAAFENAVSEWVEGKADTKINQENSQRAYDKLMYLAQGATEEQAEALADEAQKSRIKQAALTGAIFGGGMTLATNGLKKMFGGNNNVVPELEPEEELPDSFVVYQGDQPKATVEAPKATVEPEIETKVPEVVQPEAKAVETPKAETPKEYTVQELNGKNGKKIYTVREVVDDSTTRPAEAGKVYNTRAEAEQALARIAENEVPETPKPTVEKPKANAPKAPAEPVIKRLEGAELDDAKARLSEYDAQLLEIEEKIKAQQKILNETPDLKKNKAKRGAAFKELKKLQEQAKSVQKQKRITSNNVNGKLNAVKDLLDDDDRYALFDNRDGLVADINYAQKFAGDSKEAKALAKEAKDALDKYVESGDQDDFYDFVMKVEELDRLAREVNAEYKTKKGRTYTHDDYFGQSKIEATGEVRQNGLSDNVAMRMNALRNAAEVAQGRYTMPEAEESAPITVYRGYNKSDNPFESNLTRTQSIYDVLGKDKPYAEENLPLSYFTESEDVANRYANQNADYLKIMEEDARREYRDLQAQGKKPNVSIDEYASRRALEKYKTLTGNDYQSNGRVESRQINPKKALDLSDLGEVSTVDDIYKYLSEKTGISELDLDKALLLSDLESEGLDDINVFRLLRNEGNGRVGSRFVEFLRNNGYDSVRYAEDGTNHWAILNPEDSTAKAISTEMPEPEVPTQPIPEVRNPNQGTYTIPENNRVPEMTPPEPPEKTRLSRRYESLKNSDLMKRSEANAKMNEEARKAGVYDRDVESRIKAQEEAINEYINDTEAVRENNLKKSWNSGKDIDTSMLMMHDALEDGNQAEFNLVALKQAEELGGAGRVLRATRDYSGTKEGTLAKGVEFLNDKAEGVLKNKKANAQFDAIASRIFNDGDYSGLQALGMDERAVNNIREAIEAGASKDTIKKMLAMYQAVGSTGISNDAIQKINAIYNEIEARNLNPTSKARAELELDAYKVLAQDIGGKRTVKEMWDAWRYLAMLGNPKTHIRNLLGNTTHYMVTEIKDNLAATLEDSMDRANRAMGGQGIERTKARLTTEDSGLVAKSAQDADDVAYAMLNDSGSKYNVKDEISRARDSFNNKAMSKIDELNSTLLDREDYSALKRKYSKSLARYLKANGADESIFEATDDASKALLDKARAYAIDEAKQATFHEYSKLAETLNMFSNRMQNGNIGEKAAGMAIEGLVPFKKTPINILKQAIKYSPVSLAKGIGKVMDNIKTGNSTAADAIEDFASGLTGTGIMALGYFLAQQGYLTGGQNADWDVDNAESEQGSQNYAIKIGDKSYTLDWLAPMSLPLFVGAELNKMFNDDGEDDQDTVDKVMSALSTIAEPVTEMSMLQGIQNALNELSYSRENVLGTLGANTIMGYTSQAVPTLAGQIARAADPYRRSTYSDQPSGFKRQFDKTTQKMKNKLPFLSMLQQPYIDYKGNMQETQGLASSLLGNNFGTRLIDQMVSPGYYKEGNVTAVDKELNRLYESTGIDVYPNVASGKVDDVRLSKEDFTKYQQIYGKNTDDFFNAFMATPEYQSLDDQTKAEALDKIRYFARKIADYEVGGKALESKTDQQLYKAYKQNGASAIAEYYKNKAQADSLGLSVDTYLKQQDEYAGGAAQYAADRDYAKQYDLNVSQYQKVLDQAGAQSQKVLNDLPALIGMDMPKSSYYTYANAVNVIPSLTPEEFAQTYNAIDTNKENAMTQTEMLDFLNSNNLTEEQANTIWYAYGGWTNKKGMPKKIKLENGVFKSYY